MSIAIIASEALGILRERDAEFYADTMRALVRDDVLIKASQRNS